MYSWIVTQDREALRFESFQEAVEYYRKTLENFYKSNDHDGFGIALYPFDVGSFFSYKYDQELITDEEIITDARMGRLMYYLFWLNDVENLNRIKHGPINYHGEIEEFPAELSVSITYSKDEITAGFEHFENGEKTFLKTNAFIFKDSGKAYYFKTHQIIRVVNGECRHLLGTSVDLDLTLTREDSTSDNGTINSNQV